MTEDKFDVALRLYDEWRAERDELGRLESEEGTFSSNDWQGSDDFAVELADDLASLLREVLGR